MTRGRCFIPGSLEAGRAIVANSRPAPEMLGGGGGVARIPSGREMELTPSRFRLLPRVAAFADWNCCWPL